MGSAGFGLTAFGADAFGMDGYFTSTAQGAPMDYSRYLYSALTKNDRLNDLNLLDFALVPFDSGFTRLSAGSYIAVSSATYPNWFSGYITNEPDYEYLGSTNGQPVWGFKYKATSDAVILSNNPLGICGPFINLSQGEILSQLANQICPGLFDCTGVQDGIVYPMYTPDATKTFSDIVSDFCKVSQYRFSALNHCLFYAPTDVSLAPFTVDGNDKNFTPSVLSVTTSPNPIINQAVVVGGVEAQNNITEFFCGDGFTGQFNLASTIYGGTSTLLLDEEFSSGSISTQTWDVYDANNKCLSVSGGYLNCTGGAGTGNSTSSLSVHLDTANTLQLVDSMRLTHGNWDILDTGTATTLQGVICGMWTAPVTMTDVATFPGCAHGLRVIRSQNLVPDSDGTMNSWKAESGYTILHTLVNGGNLSGNAWQYTGTGSASSYKRVVSSVIAVTPGSTYTLSGFIDATNVTVGTPGILVYNVPVTTAYVGISIAVGTKGVCTATFTVPALVTSVVVICDTNNCTVANGSTLTFSNPQLELGSVATPYTQGLASLVSPNLIPDSGNVNASTGFTGQSTGGTWSTSTQIAVELGIIGNGNSWEYIGTGIASGLQTVYSQTITVVPGASYTLSGYISAISVPAGNVGWFVYDASTMTVCYGSAVQANGSGVVSGNFVVPIGVTQVCVIAGTNNATVSAGQEVVWQFPQLQAGSVPTPYQPSNTVSTQRNLMLNPIVNGKVITNQYIQLNMAKRYVFRTLLSVSQAVPQTNEYNAITVGGHITNFGVNTSPSAYNVTATLYVSQIDPITGALDASFPVIWTNHFTLPPTAVSFLYVPLASNDLNCSVSSITLSVPLTAKLQIMPAGTHTYVQKLLGPNDVDALDSMTPYATVTQSSGSGTSSALGTQNYIEGNPQLQFFKDTNALTSTVPQLGDIVCLSYLRAGDAVGAVNDPISVSTQSTNWGDSGVRAMFYNSGMTPVPTTSQECELAAAAIVGGNNYTHFDGTYSVYSTYVTAEPESGMILPFINLPSSTFGVNSFNEPIYQVDTTFDVLSLNGQELFTHSVQFGKTQPTALLNQQLSQFQNPVGTIQNSDSVDASLYVAYSSVGGAFISDVQQLTLNISSAHPNGVDPNYVYIDTKQSPPVGGGFEVRYTDSSWGADDGMNLVGRYSSSTFTVPRNQRGQLFFVKQYDGRNNLLWSEDMTQWTATTATVVNSTSINPDSDYSTISTATLAVGGKLTQPTTVLACGTTSVFTVSVKGTAGQKIKIAISAHTTGGSSPSPTITLTGGWQRVSVTSSDPRRACSGVISCVISNASATPTVVEITRASLEVGITAETVYCKTNGIQYGVMSRFSSGFKCSFPFIPPAPTATINMANPAYPVVNIVAPALLQDVWGFEVRASDNVTVLADIELADYTGGYIYNNSLLLSSLSFYVYSYNILGEYSAAFNCTTSTMPPTAPVVSAPLTALPLALTFGFNMSNSVGISGYWIYKYATNTVASSTRYKWIPQQVGGGTYTFTDTVGYNVSACYWVSTVNTIGLESTLSPTQSGTVVSLAETNYVTNYSPTQYTTTGVNGFAPQSLAYDGDISSAAVPNIVHSDYGSQGVWYGFNAIDATVGPITNVSLYISTSFGNGTDLTMYGLPGTVVYGTPLPLNQGLFGSAIIEYSVDGGVTYSPVVYADDRSQKTDMITLSNLIDLTKVYVRVSSTLWTHISVYEIWATATT